MKRMEIDVLMMFIMFMILSSPVYSAVDLSGVFPVTVISLFLGLAIIIILYYIGSFMMNPRITAWAKQEFAYMILMGIVVIFITGIINFFNSIPAADVLSFGVYNHSITGSPSETIYETSQDYLDRIADDSMDIISELQYNLGVGYVRVSLSKYGCKSDELATEFSTDRPATQVFIRNLLSGGLPIPGFTTGAGCVLTFAGGSATSWADYQGDYMRINIYTMLLNTATVSLINTIIMKYFLVYANSRFITFMLPAGLLVGSIPFMRKVGGVMIAIAIGFLIILPLSYTLINYLWLPVYNSEISIIHEDVLSLRNSLEPSGGLDFSNIWGVIDSILNGDVLHWADVPTYPRGIYEFITGTTAVFVSAVFMTYLALAITIAGISSIAKTFGGEISMSKMMQML